jgi:hypothetical protein
VGPGLVAQGQLKPRHAGVAERLGVHPEAPGQGGRLDARRAHVPRGGERAPALSRDDGREVLVQVGPVLHHRRLAVEPRERVGGPDAERDQSQRRERGSGGHPTGTTDREDQAGGADHGGGSGGREQEAKDPGVAQLRHRRDLDGPDDRRGEQHQQHRIAAPPAGQGAQRQADQKRQRDHAGRALEHDQRRRPPRVLEGLRLLAHARQLCSGERAAGAQVLAPEPERGNGDQGHRDERPQLPAPPGHDAAEQQRRPGLGAQQRGEEGERQGLDVRPLRVPLDGREQQRREQRLRSSDAGLEKPPRCDQQRRGGQCAGPGAGRPPAEPVRQHQRHRGTGPREPEPQVRPCRPERASGTATSAVSGFQLG